jgi:hypothetical protein
MSLAEGALAALQTGQQFYQNRYNQNTQRAALQIDREQQDIRNAAERERQETLSYKNVMGDIFAHRGDVSSPWNTQDWEKLQSERPDLLAQLANIGNEDYRYFTNEQGERVGAELSGFNREEDDQGNVSYVPMMRRKDNGVIAPMTENRSADPNDTVVRLSADEFNNEMNARYQAGITRDGFVDNQSALLAGASSLENATDQISQARLRQGILSAAVEQGATNDPAAASDFYYTVNQTNDVDQLVRIYESQGGNAEELLAQARAEAETQWNESSAASDPQAVTQEDIDAYREGQDPRSRLNRAGLSDDEIRATLEAPSVSQAEIDAYREGVPPRQRRATARMSDDEIRDRLIEKKSTFIQRRQQAVAEERQSAFDAETMPDFNLSPESVREAILSNTEVPTQQQQVAVSNVLSERGISNEDELVQRAQQGQISPTDQRMIAWVMASTHSGSSSEKAALAQNLINRMERGDMDVGVAQQASIESARDQIALAGRNYLLNLDKFRLESGQYNSEAAQLVAESSENLLISAGKIVGFMDEDGTPTDANPKLGEEQALQLARLLPGANIRFRTDLDSGASPQVINAHLRGLNGVTSLYLQAMAGDNKYGMFNSEFWADFLRPDAPNRLDDFDLRNIQFGPNVVNGQPTSFAYVDDQGIRGQTISFAEVREDSQPLFNTLYYAAQANVIGAGSARDAALYAAPR